MTKTFRRLALSWFRFIFLWERWRTYVQANGGSATQLDMGRHSWHADYCADPFLFYWRGTKWLFYETLDKRGKGLLGCFKEVNGKWVQQGKILELPCHLSYPQVFEEDGCVYMIPESFDRGNGGVHLFVAVDFPMKWKKVSTLITGGYVDSTLLRRDGYYYLACDLIDVHGHESAELWCSSSLKDSWRRHPAMNPISNSPRLRRCGGRYLVMNNQLYRIAQDCNGAYGKRVYRVPVKKVSPTEYQEGSAELLLDRWFEGKKLARHTYNVLEVDGVRYVTFDVRDYILQSPGHIIVESARFIVYVVRGIAKTILRRRSN